MKSNCLPEIWNKQNGNEALRENGLTECLDNLTWNRNPVTLKNYVKLVMDTPSPTRLLCHEKETRLNVLKIKWKWSAWSTTIPTLHPNGRVIWTFKQDGARWCDQEDGCTFWDPWDLTKQNHTSLGIEYSWMSDQNHAITRCGIPFLNAMNANRKHALKMGLYCWACESVLTSKLHDLKNEMFLLPKNARRWN